MGIKPHPAFFIFLLSGLRHLQFRKGYLKIPFLIDLTNSMVGGHIKLHRHQ